MHEGSIRTREKRWALLGAGVALFIAVTGGYRLLAESQLVTAVEQANVAVTRTLANAIWPDYASYFATPPVSGPEALRQRPETAEIHRRVVRLAAHSDILKLKIYSLSGLTVYSSDFSQIGGDASGKAGFSSARESREPASELVFRNNLNAFEGTVSDRDLVTTYAPVRLGNGPVQGVVEVYRDVGPLVAGLNRSTLIVGFVSLVLAGLGTGLGLRALSRFEATHKRLAEAAEQAETHTVNLSQSLVQSRQQSADLRRRVGLLEMLHRTAFEVRHAPDSRRGLQECLRNLCTYQGFPVGHVYFRSTEDPDRLVPSGIWHLEDPEAYATFRQATEETVISRGQLLPGRVLETGTPVWTPDITAAADFVRQAPAQQVGLRAGLAVPVVVGSEITMVIETFTSDPRRIDESLLGAFAALGVHLGYLIGTLRAEEALAHARDELELRFAESSREAEESRERLDAVFNHTFQFIGLLDWQGNLLEVNRSALDFIGAKREEVLDRRFCDTPWWVHSPTEQEKLRDGIRQAADGAFIRFETSHRSRRGELHTIDFSLKPVPDPRGGVEFLVAEGRDVTDRKQIEEKLVSAIAIAETANRAKSDFLAHMSHELRTPLNAVIGFADMIEHEMFGPVGNPHYQDYAGSVRKSGEHLLELIDDLLDVAVIEADRLELQEEPLDIPRICRAALRMVETLADHRQVRIDNQAPDNLPQLNGDARRLKQILLNLLSNAVKYTGPGGSVTLKAHAGEDGGLSIIVADTGVGMDAEALAKAATPFGRVELSYVRQQEGTGLGLYLTERLAEAHGGALELDSEPGVGTVATVHFPAERVIR